VDEFVVKKLRRRAVLHGVSAEEEHRRILREALLLPDERQQSLMEFLLTDQGVASEVELEIDRSQSTDSHRDLTW
jgi:plasmid stability protein